MDLRTFLASAYALLVRTLGGDPQKADEQIDKWAMQYELAEAAERRRRGEPGAEFFLTDTMKKQNLAAMAGMGQPAPRRE